MIRTDDIRFRPLAADDFPMLTRWLAEPHVRRFYQKDPITLAEVAEEYGPVVRGEEPSLSHVALSADRPFGYIQCYANMAYPDYARAIGVDHGVSVDLHRRSGLRGRRLRQRDVGRLPARRRLSGLSR